MSKFGTPKQLVGHMDVQLGQVYTWICRSCSSVKLISFKMSRRAILKTWTFGWAGLDLVEFDHLVGNIHSEKEAHSNALTLTHINSSKYQTIT